MEFICDYMRDDAKRHALSALAQRTFGIDFEAWVKDGYFEGDYIPYSLIEDGRLLSNVSVNRMQFVQNGAARTYIQLGTVMTDAAHRRRGLARRLMERVLCDWEGRCDGVYLHSIHHSVGIALSRHKSQNSCSCSDVQYSVSCHKISPCPKQDRVCPDFHSTLCMPHRELLKLKFIQRLHCVKIQKKR